MPESRQRHYRLAVFLAGLLLANFPILAIVDRLLLPGGVPFTPLYLFVAWLGLIALMALSRS